jgi:putative transposase
MNRPGKVTDNAFIESFFHSMKPEVFHGYRFNHDGEVRAVLKSHFSVLQPRQTPFVFELRVACDV